MKSLAIIGMMFLSIGAFAQQESRLDVLEKEKVCIVKRDQVGKSDKMKLAPRRQVDARKTTARCCSVNAQKRNQVKRAEVKNQRIVPLKRKNINVDSKL